MKLVAGAGEAAKAHTLKAVLDIQVCKTHFLLFCAHCSIARTPGVPFSNRASRAIFLDGAPCIVA
jgi:hypothetical protein